jgi:dTDP-4-dehydrorhamnose reductase
MRSLLKKTIFITGGSGLLAVNWAVQARDEYNVILGLHNKEINMDGVKCAFVDLESKKSLLKYLDVVKPDLVIHTAGLTNIEICEKEPELAKKVNVELAVNVCEICKKLCVPMVHISTDNIFPGTESLVRESHTISPVNVYGKTKAEAETRILEAYSDVLVVRTNFYGWGPLYRPSFSDMIISALQNEQTITLFEDVFYTPILISKLSAAVHELLNINERGVFHIVGDERLSKLEFGYKIAKQFKLDQKLIHVGKLADIPNLTKRPFDMSLSNKKTCKALGKKIGSVNEQLATLFNQDNTEVNITSERTSK